MVGINFKDLLTVTKKNIIKGRLEYNRAKTDTIFSVKLEPEAQEIIQRLAGKTHMLHFIETKAEIQEKKDRKTELYKDVLDDANGWLKRIAANINEKAGKEVIAPDLSTYYARHSWGTIASKLEISHDIVQQALGHTRTVTDRYINFYVPRIDKANRQIIDAVLTADLTDE